MYSDQVTPFAIAEPKEKESGLTVIQATLQVPSELELVVVSGGPVFLFKGSVNQEDAHNGTHSVTPTFDLCAAVGMVASCLAPASIGQVTICADQASVGYFRQVDCAKKM